jgi:hypothetical protein
MNDNKNKDTKVVDFNLLRKEIDVLVELEEDKLADTLEKGFKTFEDMKEDLQGFIILGFDSSNNSSVVYAGECDLTQTLGTMEILKNILLKDFAQVAE